MSGWPVSAVIFFALVATVGCGPASQPTAPVEEVPPAVVPEAPALLQPMSDREDGGVYRFYLNESLLVTTEFEWGADGSYRGDYVLTAAGQSVRTQIDISTGDDGSWQTMHLETAAGPVDVKRDGPHVEITTDEKVSSFDLEPNTLLMESFSPALMRLAVDQYDAELGGKQTFPLFVVPAAMFEATLEPTGSVEVVVGGHDEVLSTWIFGLPGVDVVLHVDAVGRLVFVDVPAQHGAYVREGYESMLLAAESDPLLSAPEHEVEVDKNVMVPMRDGVELATDVYRPSGEGPFPVILIRTPYGKELQGDLGAGFYVRRGYVVAVQDCRGRFASSGVWTPFMDEAHDGYDAVEWVAVQPWSNGKVGMIGASYVGWVQWWAARERPPHLVTIIPNVAPPDPFFNIPYEYGVFFIFGAIWWAEILETEATSDLSGQAMRHISENKYALLLRHLPVIELDEKILGKKNPYWRSWIEHPNNDTFWEPANFLEHLADVNIPVFHQSGWFDGDGIGSKLNYRAMRSHGHGMQKLVLGPWGHTDQAQRRVGDEDFGPGAIIDLQRAYLRWFDHWLKGVENGIDREPLVSIFVMGANEWRHGDVYPLPETRMTKLYLHSGGHANTADGDGTLSLEPPKAGTPSDQFTYDPGDPTPAPHYYVKPEDLKEDEPGRRQVDVEAERAKRKAWYGRVISDRKDILVYRTPPLTEPMTFAGPLEAVIYASSSAKDTDFFVRVAEVRADGEVFGLVEGKIRARFRKSMKAPELLTPGEVYAYHIDLWQTGIRIPEGHRLQVEVASAAFPLFSRNLNTGGHNEMETEFVSAEQTILHDAEHPSHVVLPMMP